MTSDTATLNPYAVHEWRVSSSSYSERTHKRDETIFAVANGYLGVRANFESRLPKKAIRGTYLNGFHDTSPIVYPEGAHAFAKNRQTMLNVMDSQLIEISCNETEVCLLGLGQISDFEQTLDMQAGTVRRSYVWTGKDKTKLRVTTIRFASFVHEHLFVQKCTVEMLSGRGSVSVRSILDGDVHNQVAGDDPRVGSGFTGRVLATEQVSVAVGKQVLLQRTARTNASLACVVEHNLALPKEAMVSSKASEDSASVIIETLLEAGDTIGIEKIAGYYSQQTTEGDLVATATADVARAAKAGFAKLEAEQRAYMDEFWAGADVRIEGDPLLQQGIRFNLYHLLQSVGKNGKSNIAAKGLTGEGYEGHYFWDTEVYVLPVFLFTKPQIARKLIEHRCSFLPKARERAREMSQKGALFAWRTIAGEETSAYYPAGTAQYHINAAVFIALKRYVQATGDTELLRGVGAEMLFETARLWADLGVYIYGKGFCINGVTGPDEYTAVVNNNAYTNFMAKDHLAYAVEVAKWLRREHPEDYKTVAAKVVLKESEIEDWQRASDNMMIPVDENLGIIKQDDSFLDKKPWDFAGTPKDKYPLLLNFHPLVIYRHQVLKQADLVLALFVQGDRFSRYQKKRNFDFYEPLTTHDSSLSTSIHSIMASEIGYLEKAYQYFMHTARTDLDDLHENTGDGIHAAAMAGTWAAIVHGFAGMREHGNHLSFNPRLPAAWKGYSFRLRYQGRTLLVEVSPDQATYSLVSGEPVAIRHRSQRLQLTAGRPLKASIRAEFKAAVFDLDGVITDTAECHFKAWGSIAAELGIPFDREYNEKLKGISRMESLNLILARSTREFSRFEREELARRKNQLFLEMVNCLTPNDILPGIKPFLIELKKRGIKTAVASASKNAQQILQHLGLSGEFDHVVDAAQVGKGKPDPEVFVRAADALGLCCEECVGIEDAQSGVEAVKAAGMFVVGIGKGLQGCDLPLGSTAELNVDAIMKLVTSHNPTVNAPE